MPQVFTTIFIYLLILNGMRSNRMLKNIFNDSLEIQMSYFINFIRCEFFIFKLFNYIFHAFYARNAVGEEIHSVKIAPETYAVYAADLFEVLNMHDNCIDGRFLSVR